MTVRAFLLLSTLAHLGVGALWPLGAPLRDAPRGQSRLISASLAPASRSATVLPAPVPASAAGPVSAPGPVKDGLPGRAAPAMAHRAAALPSPARKAPPRSAPAALLAPSAFAGRVPPLPRARPVFGASPGAAAEVRQVAAPDAARGGPSQRIFASAPRSSPGPNSAPAQEGVAAGKDRAEARRGAASGQRGESALRARLLSVLLPRLDYPLLARRRGWQGTVKLALTIEGDGRVGTVEVLVSSGHRLLDQSAARQLASLSLGSRAGAGPVTVVVPVRYELR